MLFPEHHPEIRPGLKTCRTITFILFLLFAWIPGNTHAQLARAQSLPELDEVTRIVDAEQIPDGVVFVIYEYEYDALKWITPRLSEYVSILRKHYPDLSIAVVSHGDEMLALSKQQRQLFIQAHQGIQELVEGKNIRFHVCGAYASFNGLSAEDFPSYIDVVPFGPAQISDYIMLGYEIVDLALTW